MFLNQCDPVNGCGKHYPVAFNKCPKCGNPQAFAQPFIYKQYDYAYDIETYPNVFTFAATRISTGDKWRFEISHRRNDAAAISQFCLAIASVGGRLVGFNNVGFDWPVTDLILEFVAKYGADPNNDFGPWLVAQLYAKAQAIIDCDNRFEHRVWAPAVTQVDLFLIHHFDNKNRGTSLKMLEYNMRSRNIIDLPFTPGTVLNDDEIEILHQYNAFDVIQTVQFYARSYDKLVFRDELSIKYRMDCTNFNDTKIGKQYFINQLEARGIQCYDRGAGRKQPRQTWRPEIRLADAVFDYVQFERPEFQMIRNYFTSRVIRQTKGAFDEIIVTPEMLPYMAPEYIRVREPGSKRSVPLSKFDKPIDWQTMKVTAQNDKGDGFLHCVVEGVVYRFGTGGLHGSIHMTDIRTTGGMQIVDVDVASYYPNLAIKNRLYPEHLGPEFCDIYDEVYVERQGHAKGTSPNAMLKLALNGVYGETNSEYSPLYDPLYTMRVTINGQLLLCMLIEQLIKVPGLQMIQANTDGVTFYCPVEYLDHTRSVCDWWERLTLLELERVDYDRMIIRDVNSYMALYEGKVKRIGAYSWETAEENPETRELGYHRDWSAIVVAKAAQAHLVDGTDIADYIANHDFDHDFTLRTKISRADRLVMRFPGYDTEHEQQRITRYYVAKDYGGELIKIMPPQGVAGAWKRKSKITDAAYNAVIRELQTANGLPGEPLDSTGLPWDERINTKNKAKYDIREQSVEAGQIVAECNDFDTFDRDNVNDAYYIAEVKKLTEGFTRVG